MGLGVIWIEVQRRLKLVDRRVDMPSSPEKHGVVVMDSRGLRTQLQRRFVFRTGLLIAAETLESIAMVRAKLAISRSEPNGLLEVEGGFVRFRLVEEKIA